MSARIVICGAQVPFVRGGAETLYESLRDELRRRGHEAEIVTLPFNWRTRPPCPPWLCWARWGHSRMPVTVLIRFRRTGLTARAI